ncbi:MAG: hypothetical protein IT378_08715, partial [Sandaracinaceae bacterium]|nr:hypothetical protein [Sandaracinaceae bacterium]
MSTQILAVRRDEATLMTPSLVELPDLLADPDVVVWVNLDTQGAESTR